MEQISTEQALQIPQQLRRQQTASQNDRQPTSQQNGAASGQNRSLSDETVTLTRQSSDNPLKKINVKEYKSELGNEVAFIRETLRNKLAEFNLHPNTPLNVGKDAFGELELKGPLMQTELDRISEDLKKSAAFVQAFNRVSQQQPTLNYIDNVVKLSNAYGVSNNLFNTLLSEDEQYNGLSDIAHRYQAMRSNTETAIENTEASGPSRFEFVVS